MTASLGLGDAFNISNLQLRLYMVPTSSTAPIVGGVPPGNTLIQSWLAGTPG